MTDIRLYSPYDRFNHMKEPQYINWVKTGHTEIECYYDANVLEATADGIRKFALLIEPRGVLEDSVYDYMLTHYSLFDYVFTHDSELLKRVPNSRAINFANIWYMNPSAKKTKGISMVCSSKKMTKMHLVRQEMADKLKGYVDLYGDYVTGGWTPFEKIFDGYRFSVVVENCINNFWFTEKICNCFANKIVPIYYGAKKIDNYFNKNGIIFCNENNVLDIVKNLDIESEYEKRKNVIEENYKLVQKYEVFEDWFYIKYKDLLGL